jgi:hypothetical protein
MSDFDAECLGLWNKGVRKLGKICERLGATQIEVEDAFVRLVAARKIK